MQEKYFNLVVKKTNVYDQLDEEVFSYLKKH